MCECCHSHCCGHSHGFGTCGPRVRFYESASSTNVREQLREERAALERSLRAIDDRLKALGG